MIEFRNVHASYDASLPILKGVSFLIESGEFVAFAGTNGAGKSTTMRLVNGLLKPDSGEVLIDGVPTTQLKTSAIARKVGFLFQNPDRQICCNTVREELLFGFEAQDFAMEDAEARVDAIIEEFGFDPQADPFLLNRGTRQLLALASVIVLEPPVIVLDEPTTGLDYRECSKVMDIVRRLHEDGTTVIMVCHDMEVVADYAQRVIVMTNGRVVDDGPVFDVLRNRTTLQCADLVPPQVVGVAMVLGDGFSHANTLDEMMAAVRVRSTGDGVGLGPEMTPLDAAEVRKDAAEVLVGGGADEPASASDSRPASAGDLRLDMASDPRLDTAGETVEKPSSPKSKGGFLEYVPGESFLHRMNPVAKLLGALLVSVACFCTGNLAFLAAVIVFDFAVAASCGMMRQAVGLAKAVLGFSLLLAFIQLLTTPAGDVLVMLPWGYVGMGSVMAATATVLRLVGAAVPLFLVLYVTKLTDLSNAMVKTLRVPYRYAFTFTSTVHFIPVFMNDMKGIMEAQTARGVEFDSGSFAKKLRLMVPLCVPLLVSSVRKTNSAAIAAEVRGFNLRTSKSGYKEYPLAGSDYAVLAACLVLVCVAVAL